MIYSRLQICGFVGVSLICLFIRFNVFILNEKVLSILIDKKILDNSKRALFGQLKIHFCCSQ